MAGLGPAIHAYGTAWSARQVVDPRAKPGDDGVRAALSFRGGDFRQPDPFTPR
ncbi:hypothetical protein Snov_3050 [Ancylobacter novellus DSM 506]|uniref:Uncharacterized protein n=1 Tax=Ancylobacter novellus (strain ATCC 8093 / DSM 506 / JCM 20403 / CCM 1077 / IAM 12100 / NBRC 12443 / NCIMB 10456) TaxID=639283 RepID=D7A794_ANCN5|nr:hypothetical protein Snov_3050 [Ancylobacter novellus DSM 506]